jgi:putative aldouronate transport system permease protein
MEVAVQGLVRENRIRIRVQRRWSTQSIRWSRARRLLRRNVPLVLMALPAVVWILINNYIPMAGIIIAFKNFRPPLGIWKSPWAGLQNFQYLFATQDGWRILQNSLLNNGLFIVTNTVLSVAVAILLYRVYKHYLTRFYQSAMFFPYFISWVIVQTFVFALLDPDRGLMNQWLAGFGVEKIYWYSEASYWRVILALVNLWKGVGFWSIIYLAGLMAISPEIYEAAEVDGASAWQQTWRITLPLLLPLITINVLLLIGRILYSDFGLFYIVPREQGLLYPVTDVIDTYVFRALRTTGKIGMASAAGFYQAVVGLVLVVVANAIVRRLDPDKALF